MEGLEALRAKLLVLREDEGRKALRRAVRRAAAVLEEEARGRAAALDDPATREIIAKNITAKFSSRYEKQTGDFKVRVGVLGGARQYTNNKENRSKGRVGRTYQTLGDEGNPGGDTFYWRFLEFGTARAPAQPFLRPAAEAAQDRVFSVFAEEAERAIDRLIARASRGARR